MNNQARKPNAVTSKWTAIIDGKSTGLAGCIKGCMGCIRGDSALERTTDLSNKSIKPGLCRHRIGY